MRFLLAFVGLLVGATLLTSCGSGGSGNSATPTPTATPTATPTPTPTPAAGISAVEARAYVTDSLTTPRDNFAARVEITWRPPSDIPTQNILEYHIYRDDHIIGVGARMNTQFIDDASLPAGTTVPYSTTGANGGATDSLTTLLATIPTLTVGETHFYRITVLYQSAAFDGTTGGGNGGGNVGGGTTGGGTGGGGGGGNGVTYRETALSMASGPATPLARPGITEPTTAQDIRHLSVTFETVPGADTYVFEFSSTADFKNKVVLGPFPFSYADAATISAPFDLSASFPDAAFPAGTRLFFRVGARALTDTPGPISIGTPNGGDYIYSAPSTSFTRN